MLLEYLKVAKTIDHALLAPDLPAAALEAGLLLARDYGVASVCILPYYVERARDVLSGTGVRVSTTIAFPHGAQATASKAAEAERALGAGAEELDVVSNVSQALSGNWDYVRADLQAVVETAHASHARVKVIFENGFLQEEHKLRLCELCAELKVDWVKTSTGFGPGGATLDDVRLMRRSSPPHVQVKAAGGVRDLDTLLTFLPFVTRVGTSRTQAILDECRLRLDLPAIAGRASGAPGAPSGSY